MLLAVDPAGAVIGWGSLNRFNPRAAYDHVADFSLFVEREVRGRGVGGALLDALEARAQAIGHLTEIGFGDTDDRRCAAGQPVHHAASGVNTGIGGSSPPCLSASA